MTGKRGNSEVSAVPDRNEKLIQNELITTIPGNVSIWISRVDIPEQT
jgi:hypothetical protein